MSELHNVDEGASVGKRIEQGAHLGRQALKNFMRDATPGQKLAAAATVGGAAYHGIRRGRKEWKRADKTNRASRTAKGAAKGAFSGAIGGAITGYGVGKAVDYLGGYQRKSSGEPSEPSEPKPKKYWRGRPMEDYPSPSDMVDYILDNPDESVSDVLEGKYRRLFKSAKAVLDPRTKKLSIAGGAALGAVGAAVTHHDDESASDRRKRIAKAAAVGAAGGYGTGVLHRLHAREKAQTRHNLRKMGGDSHIRAATKAALKRNKQGAAYTDVKLRQKLINKAAAARGAEAERMHSPSIIRKMLGH